MSLSHEEEVRLVRALLAEHDSPILAVLRAELQRRLSEEDERLRTLDGVPMYRAQGRGKVLAELLELTAAESLRKRLKAMERR